MARKPAKLSPAERVALKRATAQIKETLETPDDSQVDLRRWNDESMLDQELMLNLWEE